MMVKSRIQWVILLVFVALSASVWGIWDPDVDPNLKFNLNFENNTDFNTIDAVSDQLGIIENCNSVFTPPWEPEPNAMFNISGDFRNYRDVGGTDTTSCRISMEPNMAIWDFGLDANTLRTITLWFGMHDGAGTFLGQKKEDYEPNDYWWQFRLRDGKIAVQFQYANTNALYMVSAKNLNELGIVNNEGWYHAAVVIDRRTRYSSKIYLNGAPIEVEVINHNYGPAGVGDLTSINNVLVGGGDDDYDGLLDEIRLYHRDLNDTEISLVYQWEPNGVGPYGLLPLPNHTLVSTLTNLGWEPIAGATSQELYFGTDPNFDDPCIYVSGLSGGADSNTNADINGPLDFGTEYYWQIITDNTNVGPVWKFTTEPGYAVDPNPGNGERGIPIAPVDLQWTGSPDKTSFDVYFSDDESLVEANSVGVRVAPGITDSNFVVNPPLVKGRQYYWRVNTNFGAENIEGPVWDFRAQSNEIVVNTADANWVHSDNVEYDALTMNFLDANGDPTLVVNGSLGSDDVAIFNLSGDDANISDDYEIVVIPLFTWTVQTGTDPNVGARKTSRPMAIHVDGDFIFNGRMDISGEKLTSDKLDGYSPYARCGGYRGPRDTGSEPTLTTPHDRETGYYVAYSTGTVDRTSSGAVSGKVTAYPTATGFTYFGPGAGGAGPYAVGDGGAYGGAGGEAGRSWQFGPFVAGEPYGDDEVPVPFGGSAGGFGKKGGANGGSGGGGVEIAATGNIILGPNAEILAEGGNPFEEKYAGGGGAGGSVRIIADGNFSNAGLISVNGGRGGNANDNANNMGGGGGGGRVAIWYGGTCSEGSITANGGAEGTWGTVSRATAGQAGTIFVSSGDSRKASAPTPRDKDQNVYVSGGSGNIPLKWYSGYGSGSDQVYFGTNPNPTSTLGSPVTASRGQHTSTINATVTSGVTYYWKVVTDGSVSSDVWSFEVVDWKCIIDSNLASRSRWDSGPYCDCIEDFRDFAYFAQFWLDPDRANMGLDGYGFQRFMSQWLLIGGRTP